MVDRGGVSLGAATPTDKEIKGKTKEGKTKGQSLDEFLNQVGQAIRNELPGRYWVRAEVLKVSVSRSRHVSLELASYDTAQAAKARAWIWASNASIVKQFEQATRTKLTHGIKVLVECSVQFRADFGLSLMIHQIDANFTLGDMEAKLQAIRDRLTQLGEIDRNQRLPTPKDYTHVAVIAPQEAAGLGDFNTIADRLERFGLCQFDHYTALFQGVEASNSLVSAISQAVTHHHQSACYDAVVVIRGGGDKAGLYQLNEARIARCICRCPVPVIVGIGHERDHTLLDELANLRCATPSMVASKIQETILGNAELAKLDRQSLHRFAQGLMSDARRDIGAYQRVIHHRSLQRLHTGRQTVRHTYQRLMYAPQLVLNNARQSVQRDHHQLGQRAQQQIHLARRQSSAHVQRLVADAKAGLYRAHTLCEQRWQRLIPAARTQLLQLRSAVERHRSALVSRVTQINQQSRSVLVRWRHQLVQVTQTNLAQERAQLAIRRARFFTHAIRHLSLARQSVKQRLERVLSLDPNKVLARGFALIRDKQRQPMTRAAQLAMDQTVQIEFQDGAVLATVHEPLDHVNPDHETAITPEKQATLEKTGANHEPENI